MPTVGYYISCVRLQNQILMTGDNFRILSFDIERKCYEYVGIQDHNEIDRSIVLSGEKLYLL